MLNNVISEADKKMKKSIQVLKDDLSGVRAGRANPKLLDKISVDYYGAMTPIKQLANIGVPEPRVITIAPWDSKLISAIEKEILKSDLGITPSNDGKIIRLVFPELTEERRKELVKLINKMGEESKIAIRSIRRDAIEQLKKMEKKSEISEDDLKVAEKDVQKLTDDNIKGVENVLKDKEKEIMEL